MKATNICIAVITALTVSSIPAHAATFSAPPDYVTVFDGPSWPIGAIPAPGITVQAEAGGVTPSHAYRDGTWPELDGAAPAISLRTYVSSDPEPPILND